ncbi:MAG TPA: hypothetical protein VN761_03775 [Candidatus Polarisedimenticolia bacterium]|nr:hypothetical protein [Candidatus Polarisedimenticolia bacterium]
MCIYLGTPTHYEIAGITDYRLFLRAVLILVRPEDYLAFSSYGVRCFDHHGNRCDRSERLRPDIREFFEIHQLPPDGRILAERKSLELYRDEHPDAFAVLWPADLNLMRRLEEMLADSTDYSEFCDHVMGYGPRGELFCFHDAFCGGSLLISTRVSEHQVADFCRQLGVTYEISNREV